MQQMNPVTPRPGRRARAALLLSGVLMSGLLLPSTLFAGTAIGAVAGSRLSEILTTLGELVVGGGVLIIPIALASILTLGLAIERLWALQRRRILPKDVWRAVKAELEGGNLEAARQRAEENPTALGRMLSSGLDRWGDGPAELNEELEEAGMREADVLNTHLPALQGIASVAPLLGLLGTVVGMIRSFYTIAKEHAVGNPELFAEPIGQALVTTAAGLSVAIPAMILYYWFRGRIRKIVRSLDDVAREVVSICRRGARASATAVSSTSPAFGLSPEAGS